MSQRLFVAHYRRAMGGCVVRRMATVARRMSRRLRRRLLKADLARRVRD